jgi:predicted transcriptional regulator
MDEHAKLSRRERQIMDIVYACGEASVGEVLQRMSDPPARVSVRTLLRILEEKGHLKHTLKGKEFIYQPTQPRDKAARSALDRVLNTFFGGSIEQAVAAHLSRRQVKLSAEELRGLEELIRQAKERGK